jgi:phosphate transport system permease protein
MAIMKKKKKDVRSSDRIFQYVLRTAGLLLILVLIALLFNLFRLAMPAFRATGFSFVTGSEWDPTSETFQVLPVIYGTLVSSFLALLISVPVSLGASICLTELAPRRLGRVLSFLIEMLAAIPSVVYGLWGIFVLAPWIRVTVGPFIIKYFGFIPIFSGPVFGVGMFTAGLMLAIMITPTITAICREVFLAIPMSQREAALALGATRFEMIKIAVIRSSFSGIFGAVILGLGRALGETMAVTMVIGNRAEIAASVFAPGQTMASVIANEYAEATGDIHLSALAGVGVVLFGVSALINSLARILIWQSERVSKGAVK